MNNEEASSPALTATERWETFEETMDDFVNILIEIAIAGAR